MYQIDFHKPLHIHFIGIGGISMSGLAEILLGEDFVISGSDSKSSPLTQALEKKGATIYYGQRATNITDDVDVVVSDDRIRMVASADHCQLENLYQSRGGRMEKYYSNIWRLYFL